MMSDYISLIAISGVVGIINYWIFDALNLLNFFDHSETNEKNNLIIIFGLMNFVIYDMIRYSTQNNWPLSLYILASIFISFIAECFILYTLNKFINKIHHKNINNKSIVLYEPILKRLLEYDFGKNKVIYVYVFNLNNEIIEHGRLKYYTSKKTEDNALVLELSPNSGNLETNFNELRISFPIDESMDVYIDFEHGYKIYFYIED